MARNLARLTLGLLAICGLLRAQDARAQGVEAQLTCWNTPAETAADPLQINSLDLLPGCTIRWANNTGAAISGAQFRLTFGEAPVSAFMVHPNMPQDLGARLECPTANLGAGTFRPRLVTNLTAAAPGFVAGTATGGVHTRPFGERCADYNGTEPAANWTLTLNPGQSVTARVEFRPGYLMAGAQFESQLRVDWLNRPTDIAFTPPTRRLVVALPAAPPDFDRPEAFLMYRDVAMAGVALVGTRNEFGRPSYTGLVTELVLPYLRPTGVGNPELRIDDAFDAGAGDILLHDPTDLEVSAFVRSDTVPSGDAVGLWRDFSNDTQGTFGSLPVAIEPVAPNRFVIPYGHLSGTGSQNIASRQIRVTWVARWSSDPAVQAWLAGFNLGVNATPNITVGALCTTTDQTPRSCNNVVHRLSVSERFMVNAGNGSFLFRTNNLASRPNYDRRRDENEPQQPGGRYGINLRPPFAPWRGMVFTTYWQILGNSDGQRVRVEGVAAGLTEPPHATAEFLDVASSDGPGDFGSEEDLWARTLPTGDVWTPLAMATTPPVDAVEFRSVCTPSRYGVRTAGTNPCDVNQAFVIPFDARSSMDGSTWNERNMTQASLGAKAFLVASQPGWANTRSSAAGLNIEVDGRSTIKPRPGRARLSPLEIRSLAAPLDVAVNAASPAACAMANVGLGNTIGPVTITMIYPPGWRPTTANAVGSSFFYFSTQTISFGAVENNWLFNSGLAQLPADRLVNLTHDKDERTIKVTILGPGAEQRFVGSDEIDPTLGYTSARTLFLVVDGLFMPGASRRPEFQCTVDVTRAVRADNTVGPATFTWPPFSNHRVLGEASPSIQGATDRPRVYGWDAWWESLDMRNSAYNDNGTFRTNGAAVSARDAAAFLRVPRDGDHPESVENGTVVVRFDEAIAPEGFAVFVSTLDNPARGTASEVAASDAWVMCVSAGGGPCDSNRLGLAGVATSAVRWVAFVGGELPVTDAEPRGVAPVGGATRVERPLVGQVRLRDAGSSNGAVARPVAEFISQDSLRLVAQNGPMDVVIDAWCDARLIPVVCDAGIGQCRRLGTYVCDDLAGEQGCSAVAGQPAPERCDALDWDCNGEPLNGFDDLGAACLDVSTGCRRDGSRVCAPDGAGTICSPGPGPCLECIQDSECNDGSSCTTESCINNECRYQPLPEGHPCEVGACSGTLVRPECIPDLTTFVSILAPTAGSLLVNNDVRVHGVAEPNAEVQVTIARVGDLTLNRTLTTTVAADGTWSVLFEDATDGAWAVVAVATDGFSNTASDGPIAFGIDTRAPKFAIVTPNDGAVLRDAQLVISGRGDPRTDVRVVFDSGLELTTRSDADGTWRVAPALPLDDGPYQVQGVQRDAAGFISVDNVAFVIDTVGPNVTFTAPNQDEILAVRNIVFRGQTENGAAVWVVVSDENGEVFGRYRARAGADGRFETVPDAFPDGRWRATAVATDNAGNSGAEGELRFEVISEAPNLRFVTPTAGMLTNQRRIVVAGLSDVGATVTLVLRVEGSNTSTAETTVEVDGEGRFVWEIPGDLADGVWVVAGKATGRSGFETTAQVGFEVDGTPPALEITSPLVDEEVFREWFIIFGISEPNAWIELRLEGREVAEFSTWHIAEWFFPLPRTLEPGPFRLTATARDRAGNTTEVHVPFVVSTRSAYSLPEPQGPRVSEGANCSDCSAGGAAVPTGLILVFLWWRRRRVC